MGDKYVKNINQIEKFIAEKYNLNDSDSFDFICNGGENWIECSHGLFTLQFLAEFEHFLEAKNLVISSNSAGICIRWDY